MTQARESVLNVTQLDSLHIQNFIFHIIDVTAPEDERVVYLEEVVLGNEQRAFFIERLRDVACGTQYSFISDFPQLKELCDKLLKYPEEFVSCSRDVARDFARLHGRNMASGVLVIATAEVQIAKHQSKTLVFVVKLDNKNVHQYRLEQTRSGQRAIIERVVNSFVEDKAAVQKSALISIDGTFAWDVLATERHRSVVALSDYFAKFLGVRLREDASALTRRTVTVVNKWAKSIPSELMPEGESAGNYKARAVQYFQGIKNFDTDQFIAAVVRDDDDSDRRERVQQLLLNALTEHGIAGQHFESKPGSLPKSDIKQEWITEEGVTLTFEGDARDLGIVRTSQGCFEEIIIRTRSVRTLK